MIKIGQNICLVLLTYHQLFFPSFYGLARILKLTIRVFLFMALQVKGSTSSVRFFMTTVRLDHGIILNQNATWNSN